MSTWLLNEYCIVYCIVLIGSTNVYTLSGFPCRSIVIDSSEKQPMCTQMRDDITPKTSVQFEFLIDSLFIFKSAFSGDSRVIRSMATCVNSTNLQTHSQT